MKLFRNVAGYSCIAAGIAGCILPIIPGIPLLLVGLALLSVHNPWAARLLRWLKERSHKLTTKRSAPQARPKANIDTAGLG